MTGAWWAPIFFLVFFNIWHVGLRLGLLFWGYASGGDAVSLMARFRFTKMTKRLKVLSLTLLGCILGMMPLWRPEFRLAYGVPAAVVMPAGLAFTLVLVAVVRRGVSPVKLMLGLAVLSLALAFAGVL
jgi:mannose/fructose/N-acetylgalactosamine-specific phosphotransferase system component IID